MHKAWGHFQLGIRPLNWFMDWTIEYSNQTSLLFELKDRYLITLTQILRVFLESRRA